MVQRLLKEKRTPFIVLALTSFILISEMTFDITYPHFLFGSLTLIVILGYLIYQYGLVSVPSFVGVILMYPAFVPFITRYIYGIDHFSVYFVRVESVALASKIVSLVTLMLIAYVAFLRIFQYNFDLGSEKNTILTKNIIKPTFVTFTSITVFNLVCVFLTAPGPTLLSASYSASASYIPSWAIWAPGAYMGSWVVLFLMVARDDVASRFYYAFILVTFAGTFWLLLHGRRVQGIGIIALLFAHLVWHKLKFTTRDLLLTYRGQGLCVIFAIYVFLLFGIGRIRNWAGLSSNGGGSGTSVTEKSGTTAVETGTNSTTPLDTLNYGDGFIGVPGGAHGVYGTIRGTVSLFDTKYELLWGETFLNYIPQAVPTLVNKALGIQTPSRYSALLAANYNYNGGNYFLNIYYANFGAVGVLVAALVLATLSILMMQHLELSIPDGSITAGIAATVFISFVRIAWYSQLTGIDILQGFIMSLILYVVVDQIHGQVNLG
ncbi:hypothetical protein [Natrinema salinisoli]|uniref:hypothetical protein n=1 Tax=Natrinema salinisoli TaxID=2878535 RepID=UPI001CF0D4DA|nr:hypothetical protein [Natrinema salinisoli]